MWCIRTSGGAYSALSSASLRPQSSDVLADSPHGNTLRLGNRPANQWRWGVERLSSLPLCLPQAYSSYSRIQETPAPRQQRPFWETSSQLQSWIVGYFPPKYSIHLSLSPLYITHTHEHAHTHTVFALSGHKLEQAHFICHIIYCFLFLIFLSPDSEVCWYRLSSQDVRSSALST